MADLTRPETRQAIETFAALTKKLCGSGACDAGRWGCCDRAFCAGIRDSLALHGIEFPWDDEATLPYLGTEGCVVPPHLRPACALYSCDRVDYSRLDQAPWTIEEAEAVDASIEVIEQDPFSWELFKALRGIKVIKEIEEDQHEVQDQSLEQDQTGVDRGL